MNESKPTVKLMKANEVAQVLSISQSQTYHLMQIGELPSIRCGGLVRVKPEDLENFIANHHHEGEGQK